MDILPRKMFGFDLFFELNPACCRSHIPNAWSTSTQRLASSRMSRRAWMQVRMMALLMQDLVRAGHKCLIYHIIWPDTKCWDQKCRDTYQRMDFEVKKIKKDHSLGKGPCIYGKILTVKLKTYWIIRKSHCVEDCRYLEFNIWIKLSQDISPENLREHLQSNTSILILNSRKSAVAAA